MTVRVFAVGRAINESDMLVVPQPETAFLDPFTELPTLVMICNIQDPITREDYSRDPRNVARKAVNHLKSTGIADTAYFGPEAEFFIFDDIRFDQNEHEGYYPHRQHRRPVESWPRREAEPGLQAAAQGRLLPGASGRPDDGSAQRDDADDDRLRSGRRMPAPRGGYGRPIGDRPAVQQAGPDGRQPVDVQVHHQERGHAAQQDA